MNNEEENDEEKENTILNEIRFDYFTLPICLCHDDFDDAVHQCALCSVHFICEQKQYIHCSLLSIHCFHFTVLVLLLILFNILLHCTVQ